MCQFTGATTAHSSGGARESFIFLFLEVVGASSPVLLQPITLQKTLYVLGEDLSFFQLPFNRITAVLTFFFVDNIFFNTRRVLARLTALVIGTNFRKVSLAANNLQMLELCHECKCIWKCIWLQSREQPVALYSASFP